MPESIEPLEVEQASRQQELIEKLIRYFKSKGYEVRGAGLEGYRSPPISTNDRSLGNRDDQQPDVYAIDPRAQIAVRGIVIATPEELSTEQTRTRLLLFSALSSAGANKRSLLYIFVPAMLRDSLNMLLKDLSLVNRPHVIPLATKE